VEWIERSLPHQAAAECRAIYLSRPWANPFLTAEAELSDLPDGQISDLRAIPVQPRLQKYFALPVGQIISITSRHPASIRGTYRDRHETWSAGCGGHGSALTNDADVDGEVVWS
jgi:hypothetical protein